MLFVSSNEANLECPLHCATVKNHIIPSTDHLNNNHETPVLGLSLENTHHNPK